MNHKLNTIHQILTTIHYSPLTLWSLCDQSMQNKPNFHKNRAIVNYGVTGDYESQPRFWPKIPKANFKNREIDVSSSKSMNYEQRTMNYFINPKPNSNPTCGERNRTIYSELVEPIFLAGKCILLFIILGYNCCSILSTSYTAKGI